VDEDTGELFELDAEGIDEQTEELGTFLYDDIEVRCVVVSFGKAQSSCPAVSYTLHRR